MNIALKFPKTVTALVGFEYGEKIYKEQVKDEIQWTDDIVIVFPDEVKSVAISFVQGFYNGIVQQIGLQGAIEKIVIKACTPELVNKINDSVLSIV